MAGTVTRAGPDLRPPLTSVAARVLLLAFAAVHVGLAVTGTPGGMGAAGTVGLVILIAATAAVVLGPGDELALRWTIPILVLAMAADAVITAALPVGGWPGYAAWHLGATTFVLLGLTLRRRIAMAWLGMLTVGIECVVWAAVTGQGIWHGVDLVDRQAGTLLIGTLFAIGLRRSADALDGLHARDHERVVERHELSAAQQERRTEGRLVLELAGPALRTVADAARLAPEQRSDLRAIEGRLRDRITAPLLDDDALWTAAAEARRRGVDVALLSDPASGRPVPGLADAAAWLAEHVRQADGTSFVGRVIEREGALRASAATDHAHEVALFPRRGDTRSTGSDG